MDLHINGHDGAVHVHDCPEHPEGGAAGLVRTYEARDGKVVERRAQVRSCFFFEEHDEAFQRRHASDAVAAVAAVRASCEDPAVEERCAAAFKRLEALT